MKKVLGLVLVLGLVFGFGWQINHALQVAGDGDPGWNIQIAGDGDPGW